MDLAQTLAVETHGLTKRYSTGVLAVNNLELRVRAGEVYGFLGPNGAGKTTTLRLMSGLLHPTSGTAIVAGAAPGSPASLARLGAMVETPAFYPYLSGRDNLRVVARYASVPRSRIEPVLKLVDLTDRARHKFKTYSTGMKQRLGVAAALLKAPDLLIRATPLDQARRSVEAIVKPEQVRVEGETLLLSVDPSQAASINRRLVSDGVDVSELRVSEQSLEDVFLELTETPTLPSPASGGGKKPEPRVGEGNSR